MTARKTEQADRVEATLAERHCQRGLILFEPIGSYQEVLTKKGRRHIEIGVENEEDSYTFLIDVATDGNSYISVYPRKRERISFYGNLILD